MRVAIVTESFLPQMNGVTNSVLKVIDSLKAEGHEVIIIAPTAPSDEYLGYPVIRTTKFLFKAFPVGLPLLNMTSILRSFKPDIVHVASPFMLGRQALAVSKRLGFPTVAVYQTNIAGYTTRYGLAPLEKAGHQTMRNIHRLADINLAPTAEMARYLKKIGVNRIAVWGRGVDVGLYRPERRDDAETRELRNRVAPHQQQIIGFVGRLAPEKQVIRFTELLDLPNVAFLIVGDGTERERLERAFEGRPVTFVGNRFGEDLATAYAAMDVFVHCGEEETFGQAIQEALAAGVPVVAPAAGGPISLIQNARNGFLVNPREPNAYRTAVELILTNDELRSEMSTEARASVENKSWKANNQILFKHYRDLVGWDYQLTTA